MAIIAFLGLKGRVSVRIERISHEKLQLEISGPGYGLNERIVIKNEELRKNLLDLMKNYDLSPEIISTSDITIATYLLL